jgi:hypothetical protein
MMASWRTSATATAASDRSSRLTGCIDVQSEMTRRFPPPWTVEQIPGGYKVVDAASQSLAYVYGL